MLTGEFVLGRDRESIRRYQGRCTLVTGMFDPPHRGHMAYLEAAANFGDPVVCAVAPDAEVARKHPICVPEADRVEVLRACRWVTAVVCVPDSIETLVRKLRPRRVVKGREWQGRLPDLGVPVVYVDLPLQSSTALLRAHHETVEAVAWQQWLELIARQPDPDLTSFDAAYYQRQAYTLAARRAREGRHPALIRQVFGPVSILDVGCGPGHFMTLLREQGCVDVWGVEPSLARPAEAEAWSLADAGSWPSATRAEVVICREVLEHLPLRVWGHAIRHLLQASTRYVYVTTRWCERPTHLLSVQTADDLDVTHITRVTMQFARLLLMMGGGRQRPDLEAALDWQGLGRVLLYEVPAADL